jgi:hypothetical protein
LARVAAFDYWRKVKDGERNHATTEFSPSDRKSSRHYAAL